MMCEQVENYLGVVAKGEAVLPAESQRHIEGCLRCQAEIVEHRSILRAMRSLRDDVLEPADGMVPEILAAIEAAGERHAVRSLLHRHRVAYLSGLAAAAAAGVAGAIIIAARSRRSQPMAS